MTGEKRELIVLHRLHQKGNRTIDPQSEADHARSRDSLIKRVGLSLNLISTVCNSVLFTDYVGYFSC